MYPELDNLEPPKPGTKPASLREGVSLVTKSTTFLDSNAQVFNNKGHKAYREIGK
jgi:hypothetical protein